MFIYKVEDKQLHGAARLVDGAHLRGQFLRRDVIDTRLHRLSRLLAAEVGDGRLRWFGCGPWFEPRENGCETRLVYTEVRQLKKK